MHTLGSVFGIRAFHTELRAPRTHYITHGGVFAYRGIGILGVCPCRKKERKKTTILERKKKCELTGEVKQK